MKAFNTLLILMALSSGAQAELGPKAPLKADFNAMISKSTIEKRNLETRVQDTLDLDELEPIQAIQVTAEIPDDSKRVTDFVDAELSWGEKSAVVGGKSPQVVDRRFNSLGEEMTITFTEADLSQFDK